MALFSKNGGERRVAYETIKTKHRKNPDAVTMLLDYVRANMTNQHGISNAVVTFHHLSRTVTKPRKADINALCDNAETTSEHIRRRCDKLRTWLETGD